MRPLLAALAAAITLGGCGGDGGSERLVVAAAASLREPLTRCSGAARLSFAGSDELAAQIRQGAGVDVYAAANARLPRALFREGRVERPRAFATNELVLAVPDDSPVRRLADLAGGGVDLVIGTPSVPVGAYTRDVLVRLPAAERLAILDNVRSEEPDARSLVGKLTQGAAEAAFVYASDAAAAPGVRAIRLPRRLRPTVSYAAAVVSRARDRAAARRYVDGLRSGACARALRAAGLAP
jgi:molybdate transport system substrate-binding protein